MMTLIDNDLKELFYKLYGRVSAYIEAFDNWGADADMCDNLNVMLKRYKELKEVFEEVSNYAASKIE